MMLVRVLQIHFVQPIWCAIRCRALAVTAIARSGNDVTCLALPCPLSQAAEITVTAGTTGGAVAETQQLAVVMQPA